MSDTTTTADTTTEAAEATAYTTARDRILADAEERFGFVPNLFREMAVSPAAARVYLDGDAALADASLDAGEREVVKLAVSTRNECHYCTKAHRATGEMAGVDTTELDAILEGGEPDDERLARLVRATRLIMDKEGWLDDDDLGRLDEQGIDRRQVFDIVAILALKTLSNYVNHMAGTEVDPQLGG